ncbi:MAG TPA: radical SAM protein [Planctomycetota bacterium]|nr:radical SAM protein [Planctomycetota bacterium]
MSGGSLRCIFGPVPSRRLGRSLGVDLVPLKTCTYDCIYCQLGRTTVKTTERREYVPASAVIDELRRVLEAGVQADYLTFSGSGEPTLHAGIGDILAAAKRFSKIPVAVLTNGSLLWNKDVQKALVNADLVIPSLDAGDANLFRYVNRPHPDVTFDIMLGGLASFRQRFCKPIWLEVMLLGGVTSVDEEVRRIARLAKHMAPDRVQFNTVVRPPAEDYALRVPAEVMERLAGLFDPPAEVVAPREPPPSSAFGAADREAVLALLRRRPCTTQDVATGLGLHVGESAKLLESLLAEGAIIRVFQTGQYFHLPADRE